MPGVRLLPLSKCLVMKESLDLATEVKELLWRASNVLSNFESFAETDEGEDCAVEAAYRLLKAYIIGHQVASKPTHYEAWLIRTRGSGIF
jgi:hypothetical protein